MGALRAEWRHGLGNLIFLLRGARSDFDDPAGLPRFTGHVVPVLNGTLLKFLGNVSCFLFSAVPPRLTLIPCGRSRRVQAGAYRDRRGGQRLPGGPPASPAAGAQPLLPIAPDRPRNFDAADVGEDDLIVGHVACAGLRKCGRAFSNPDCTIRMAPGIRKCQPPKSSSRSRYPR